MEALRESNNGGTPPPTPIIPLLFLFLYLFSQPLLSVFLALHALPSPSFSFKTPPFLLPFLASPHTSNLDLQFASLYLRSLCTNLSHLQIQPCFSPSFRAERTRTNPTIQKSICSNISPDLPLLLPDLAQLLSLIAPRKKSFLKASSEQVHDLTYYTIWVFCTHLFFFYCSLSNPLYSNYKYMGVYEYPEHLMNVRYKQHFLCSYLTPNTSQMDCPSSIHNLLPREACGRPLSMGVYFLPFWFKDLVSGKPSNDFVPLWRESLSHRTVDCSKEDMLRMRDCELWRSV